MDPDECTQYVYFRSPRKLSGHAIKLHGATFTGEQAHQADHRFSTMVRRNMELQASALSPKSASCLV
jgi:hypothetical protein